MEKTMKVLISAFMLLATTGAFCQAPAQAKGTTPPQAASSAAGLTAAQRHGQPQAKTKEEFADYQTAAAVADPAAAITAADQFAQKHPQSELRYVLYSQ